MCDTAPLAAVVDKSSIKMAGWPVKFKLMFCFVSLNDRTLTCKVTLFAESI